MRHPVHVEASPKVQQATALTAGMYCSTWDYTINRLTFFRSRCILYQDYGCCSHVWWVKIFRFSGTSDRRRRKSLLVPSLSTCQPVILHLSLRWSSLLPRTNVLFSHSWGIYQHPFSSHHHHWQKTISRWIHRPLANNTRRRHIRSMRTLTPVWPTFR